MNWQRAAEAGSVSELETLLQAADGVNGMVEEHTRLTPLHYSARAGRADMVEMLLRRGAFADAVDQYNRTALYLATLHRHEAVVRLLLRQNADPNIVCQCNTSALSKAAENGDAGVLTLLVDAGAYLRPRNQDGETPVELAARNGHRVMWDRYEERMRRALVDAAQAGNVDRVGQLVRAGVDPLATPARFTSPLAAASGAGHVDVVRFLLFDPAIGETDARERVEAMGRTALHTAAEKGRAAVVGLMLGTGLSPDTRDQYGDAAVHRAAARGHTGVIEVLLAHGADINARGSVDMTPLQKAARQRQTDTVNFLVLKGANGPETKK